MTWDAVIVPLGIVWGLSILWMLLGSALILHSAPQWQRWPGLVLPLGYGLAGTAFVGVWRLLGLGMGMRFALLLTLVASLGCIWRWRAWRVLPPMRPMHWIFCAIMAGAVHAFVFIFWAHEKVTNSFAIVGSAHSPRYGNIALFIKEYDRVPLVGQNYGQSLLGSISGFIGYPSPLYDLNLWIGSALFFVVVLTFALLRSVGLGKIWAVFGSFFVLFANTALSFKHVPVVDLGWPIAVNGYFDALVSLPALLGSVWAWYGFLRMPADARKTALLALLLSLLTFSWTMSAAQNIYLFGLSALLLMALHWHAFWQRKWHVVCLVLPCLLALGLGTIAGGMLTPKSRLEAVPFGGMLVVEKENLPPLEVNVGLPMVRGSYLNWEQGIDATDGLGTRVLKSLQGVGVALLGIALALWLIRSAPVGSLLQTQILARQSLCVAVLWFASGLLLVLPFNLFGSKWAASRFVLPGYYAALLCVVIGLYFSLHTRPKLRAVVFVGTMILALWGPVNSIATRMQMDIAVPNYATERAEPLFTFQSMMQ